MFNNLDELIITANIVYKFLPAKKIDSNDTLQTYQYVCGIHVEGNEMKWSTLLCATVYIKLYLSCKHV